MRESSPIHRLLGSLDETDLQNVLMRTTDRELAIMLSRSAPGECRIILDSLSHQKRLRVEEEIRFVKRLRLTRDQYSKVMAGIAGTIKDGKRTEGLKSYIRPRRR